jgi:putative ABC transport system permease protein
VFRWIRQTIAVTALSVRTIPLRLNSSGVAILGIAGVVVVLVSVLSIGEGFKAAVAGSGRADRALVMRNGADSEMTSGLTGDETDIVKQAPGLGQDNHLPTAAAEMYVIVDLPKRTTGTDANVPLRGVEPMSLKVRPEVHIVQGRMLNFGTNEAIVGSACVKQFSGVDLDTEYHTRQLNLKIVGVFESGGSSNETEIWADSKIVQGAYRRGNTFQAVLARLDNPASLDAFRNWLTTNPQLNVQVQRESEYYLAQTRVMTSLINGIGFVIAFLMGIGAVFGAVLTMYTAVASRTREIATLRAIGFNTTSVLVSVIGESVALALIGGVGGALLAYLGFNGYQTSTMNFQTFSQVAFAFRVTPALLVTGIIWALTMGFIGALLPAIRAARLPITVALREL